MAQKSFIKQYINTRSSSTIRGRVDQVEIYQLEISASNNSAISQVFGSAGDLYSVQISNYNSALITSNCSCPYDWNGLCKHEVAVLMQLDIQVNKGIPKANPSGKKYSKTAPYIIKPFDKINATTIAAHSKPYYDYYISFKEEYIELDENEIKLTLPNTDHHWEDHYIATTVTYKNKSLVLTCDCSASNKQLCKHQNFALKIINSTISPLYFNSKHREQQWEEQLKLYGYSLKDDYKALFTSFYREGQFSITPKIDGLMPLIKESKWQQFSEVLLAKSPLEDYLYSKTRVKKSPSFVLAVGISFYGTSSKLPIQTKLLIGKPNKAGLLSSRISEIYNLEDVNNISTPLTKVADTYRLVSPLFYENLEENIEEQNSYSEKDNEVNNYPAANYILSNLSKLLTELSTEIYIYNVEEDYYKSKLTQKNIEQITMVRQSSNLEFLLTEENDFYKLECYIIINDEKIKLPNKRFHTVNFFAVVDNVYYLHKSVDYMVTLAYFAKRSIHRIQKYELENYLENFLIPLQKKYHVTIDIKSITTVEEDLNEASLSKRVYLSEVNDFVVFKPVIATGNNLLELGENSSYTIKKEDVITNYNVNPQYLEQFKTEISESHPEFSGQHQNNEFYLSFDQFGENRWFIEAFEQFKKNKIEVFGYNSFKKLKYNINRPKISVAVSSEIDWFDVSVVVTYGTETLSLATIKKAVLKQESYVKLGDGSLGYLPEDWLKKMERYFTYGETTDTGVQISKHHFSLIDELFDEIDDEELRKEIDEKKRKLVEFESIKSIKKPKGITAQLRDYQTHGFNWLVFLNEFNMGGCLADDMGLGKTLQVICLLQHQKNAKVKEPNLVVVPTSLIFNWQNEIEKFAPKLRVSVISGAKRNKNTKEYKKFDIILITYGLILRDIDYLKEYQFNYAILDESQAIKNPNSKRYKAVRLLKAHHRLVMTGTPVENGTMDLYSQISFVNPGLLGTPTFFKEHFAKAIEKDKDENKTEELKKLIKPFLIRRTKEQVATELPEKTEMILYCELEPEQRKVYDYFRDKYKNYLLGKIEEDGLGKSKMYVLEGLLKLRQICNSPALLADKEDYGNQSIKIKELLTHINENTGQHKILVFSQFVKMLDLIKQALEKEKVDYEYLDGKTKNRQEKVNNFQHNDSVRVFLISLKAGGTGLNLTSADYVYIVDPWWNPAVEAQAIDRCYRIGQHKKVIAYKMICKNTVEEKIVELQNRKMKMVKDIISTDDSVLKSLTKTDIEDLFS